MLQWKISKTFKHLFFQKIFEWPCPIMFQITTKVFDGKCSVAMPLKLKQAKASKYLIHLSCVLSYNNCCCIMIPK